MKKIYIAGAGGMLGEAFYNVFKDEFALKCTDKDVNSDWLEYLDFRDRKNYTKDVNNYNPDYLFHLGAYTDLEYCELNQDDTYNTNTISVSTATQIANNLGIPIVYISTAGIFGGEKESYDDWDSPNPLSVYGRSKYMAERYVVENANKYLVLRAGWMMGGGEKKDKKFIGKLIKQINSGTSELNIVDDKDGTPTYTYDFAETCKSLLKTEQWDLYNCVCSGVTSRLDVAKEVLKILNLEDSISINPVSSDFFKEEYFATRPLSERLINKKLELIDQNRNMRPWKDALKEYLEAEFNNG